MFFSPHILCHASATVVMVLVEEILPTQVLMCYIVLCFVYTTSKLNFIIICFFIQYIYLNYYLGLGEEEGYARRGCKVPFFFETTSCGKATKRRCVLQDYI